MKITQELLDRMFTYHAPYGNQLKKYEQIRKAGALLAEVIVSCCPDNADTTAAIRKVREAVMTANASIAIGETNQ